MCDSFTNFFLSNLITENESNISDDPESLQSLAPLAESIVTITADGNDEEIKVKRKEKNENDSTVKLDNKI